MMTLLLLLVADVYYVSPNGNDAHDGKSEARAWKTVEKVNTSAFQPGDTILFAAGGEWRESLKASSNGAAGKPITYDSYGNGGKPRFLGSDLVVVGAGGSAPVAKPVAALLQDRAFVQGWTWTNGVLKAPPGTYSACVRVDPVHSNGKNHLVFRRLIADESADVRDGYGFRVMGSDDVRIEHCEAYRAGRHHFGVINSTNFVGQSLLAAQAMPNIPGGATFYVSFSDASRKGDTHQWIDCSGERFENPGQGNYQIFYDHGEGLGPITIRNMISRGGKFSVDSKAYCPITVQGGLLEDNSLEIFGESARIEGLTIRGNGAVDNWSSDSLFENLLVAVQPQRGGPTGYGAGILMRDGAKRNKIRYCTVVLPDGAAVKILGPAAQIRMIGCLFSTKGAAVEGDGSVEHTFATGDPKLGPDFIPLPGSPVIGLGKAEHPPTDLQGQRRPDPCSAGAFEPKK